MDTSVLINTSKSLGIQYIGHIVVYGVFFLPIKKMKMKLVTATSVNMLTALELMANGNLRPSHLRAWEELWAGSTLELTGPDNLSRALIGCMFYLLSVFPSLHEAPGHFGGVSPGGPSNGGSGQDYWGHVFWDQVRTTVYFMM